MFFRLNRLIFILVLMVSTIGLIGCAPSQRSDEADPLKGTGYQPEWYDNPSFHSDVLSVTGKARARNPSVAADRATRKARSLFSSLVSSSLDDLGAESIQGVEKDELPSGTMNKLESVLLDDNASTLRIETRRVERDGNEYMGYVLMKTPKNEIKNAISANNNTTGELILERFLKLYKEKFRTARSTSN